MISITAKEVGHGITIERYTCKNGKRVVIIVSTVGGHPEIDCHYTVLDMNGGRTGAIYDRSSALKIAESKVM